HQNGGDEHPLGRDQRPAVILPQPLHQVTHPQTSLPGHFGKLGIGSTLGRFPEADNPGVIPSLFSHTRPRPTISVPFERPRAPVNPLVDNEQGPQAPGRDPASTNRPSPQATKTRPPNVRNGLGGASREKIFSAAL